MATMNLENLFVGFVITGILFNIVLVIEFFTNKKKKIQKESDICDK